MIILQGLLSDFKSFMPIISQDERVHPKSPYISIVVPKIDGGFTCYWSLHVEIEVEVNLSTFFPQLPTVGIGLYRFVYIIPCFKVIVSFDEKVNKGQPTIFMVWFQFDWFFKVCLLYTSDAADE